MTNSNGLRLDARQRAARDLLEKIQAGLEQTEHLQRHPVLKMFGVQAHTRPIGLYLWGGVGGGKSMLMDMFFDSVKIDRKRRVHFHEFMQNIHTAIHNFRTTKSGDPIESVAADIARRCALLCLDEMQIADITDAMIVGRLFEKLIDLGVILVTTSNRPPVDLYKYGLNRQLFLPFIDLMQTRLTVHHLEAEKDYRQEKIRGQQTYFSPLNTETAGRVEGIWQALAGEGARPLTLTVKSRKVVLPLFLNGVARAGFADLCARPLGAADYLAIVNVVKVLVLENIPVMSRANNNEARRFVILIDTLYEAKTRMICSAAAQPTDLYLAGDAAFEFERTASRLGEMQGRTWGQ